MPHVPTSDGVELVIPGIKPSASTARDRVLLLACAGLAGDWVGSTDGIFGFSSVLLGLGAGVCLFQKPVTELPRTER